MHYSQELTRSSPCGKKPRPSSILSATRNLFTFPYLHFYFLTEYSYSSWTQRYDIAVRFSNPAHYSSCFAPRMSGSTEVYEARLGQYQLTLIKLPESSLLAAILGLYNRSLVPNNRWTSQAKGSKRLQFHERNPNNIPALWGLTATCQVKTHNYYSKLRREMVKKKKKHCKSVRLNIYSSCTNNKPVWVLCRHAAQQGSIQPTPLRGPHKSRMLARAAKICIWYQVRLKV